MKTTKEIINDELGVILNSIDYDVNNALFEINKNKRWYLEEEIKNKINKIDVEMGISKKSLIKLLLSNEVDDG